MNVGDEVVSVDGQALDPLDPVTADDLLNGPVGSSKTIAFGSAHAAALANTTVSIRVDDLVPAPRP